MGESMQISEQDGTFSLYKESQCIGGCICHTQGGTAEVENFSILPAFRRKGYGSFLLKEVLRRTGGYAQGQPSLHTAPLPGAEGELAFWEKFGFCREGEHLVRRRKPDLTAVQLAQQFVEAHCPAPHFCIDATCGNGGDTAFLCGLCAESGGQVLAMDLQPEACGRTAARLEKAGFAKSAYHIVCDSHAHLISYAAPGSADIVLFNFGWLPGAAHEVFSTAESSLPALQAALEILRPGGILSAVLYNGRVIGTDEKQAVLAWLKNLPIQKYTVLCCDFANWADTAPLPCFVIKK
jgi:SAM-dependent methyltransferase